MSPAHNLPNIFLVVCDSLRSDAIAASTEDGSSYAPFLKSLEARSLVMSHAFSAATWSLPSYCSLFTGLIPSLHGVNARSPRLREEIPTLADSVSALGYETVGVSTNAWVSQATNLSKGFSSFFPLWMRGSHGFTATARRFYRYAKGKLNGSEDKCGQYANEVIEGLLRSRGQNEGPLFLFAIYNELHYPYGCPPTFVRQHRLLDDGLFQQGLAVSSPRRIADYNIDPGTVQPGVIEMLRKQYLIGLRYLDSLLEGLYQILTRDATRETLLIITSDHGEGFGEHGFFGHQLSLYDEHMRVPLIWHCVGDSDSEHLDDLFQTSDIGHVITRNLDTYCAQGDLNSLSRRVRQALYESSREFVISEDIGPDLGFFRRAGQRLKLNRLGLEKRAVRTRRDKLIRSFDGSHEEYFDLLADEHEGHDLSCERPARVRLLRGLWNTADAGLSTVPRTSSLPLDPSVSELEYATVRRLQDLGYLDQ